MNRIFDTYLDAYGIRWLVLLGSLTLMAPRVSAADEALDKALLTACAAGQTQRVADLLKQGADPDSRDAYARTGLHLAAKGGNLPVLQLLIESGADVDAADRDGHGAIVEAAGSLAPEAVKRLLSVGAKPADVALWRASRLGRLEAVKLLLDAGAALNPALAQAALGGRVEVVKLMLDRGAHVNARSKNGETALHLASQQGGHATVQLLLDSGADPNATKVTGQTPLHCAISGVGDLKVVQALVKAGAKLDIPDNGGMTPVRLAAMRGEKLLYEWLLTANGGTEPTAKRPAGPATPEAAKATPELVADLSSDTHAVRQVALRELVLRGEGIMPDVLSAIDSGALSLHRVYDLLYTMGPTAHAARAKLIALLADKEQVFGAFQTLERMRPGSFAALSLATQQEAVDTLYAAVVVANNPYAMEHNFGCLAQMGEVTAPHFLQLLRSENALKRQVAASALESASFVSDEVTAELVKVFQQDSDFAVRAAAAQALGKFGEPGETAKAALLAYVKQRPEQAISLENDPQRASAERQVNDRVGRSLGQFGPSIIDEFIPLLATNAPRRSVAMTALRSIGAPAIPRLIELLDHADSSVAFAAVFTLATMGQPAILAMTEAIRTGSERVILNATICLSDRGSIAKSALPVLLEVAGSTKHSNMSRVAAVRAALKIDPANCRESPQVLATIPVLIGTLAGGNFQHQAWAAEALGNIGPTARDALPTLRLRLELPAENADTGGLARSLVRRAVQLAIAKIEETEE